MHRIDENGMGKGAHVIYATYLDRDKNVKTDFYTKLWAEAEYTIKAVQMFDNCNKKIEVHLDYNSDDSAYSNVLYKTGIGYAKGMGYEAKGKPYAWAASHVADGICKK